MSPPDWWQIQIWENSISLRVVGVMLATQNQLCILPCLFSYSYLPYYVYKCVTVLYTILYILQYTIILLYSVILLKPVSLNCESCSLSVCATCCLNFAFFCTFSVPPTLNFGFKIAIRLDILLPSNVSGWNNKNRLLQNITLKIMPRGRSSAALNLQHFSPVQKFHLSLAVPGTKVFSSS